MSEGLVGAVPDYYPLLRAARYLGVPPWDLAGLPETAGCVAWTMWALEAEGAEASAQAQLRERAERAAAARRGRR